MIIIDNIKKVFLNEEYILIMETVFITKNNKEDFYGCTITYGHFSIIHPGHIRYLSNAKKNLGN